MPLYFEELGNKNEETLVFLHGGGVAGWMWDMQREAFSGYHLLIPDLPEHGRSVAEGPIDIADCAERIAALIQERAHGGKAHIVGHSLGGKLGVQMLATHPEALRKAVVASALFRPMPLLSLTLNMPAYRLTIWMLKNKGILDMQARQFGFPKSSMEENFKREAALETPESLARIYTQLNKYVLLPGGLQKAKVQTLALAGGKEPRAMRQSAVDIANALPNAKHEIIQGALHTYPWARHEAFNAAVLAFLKE